MKTFKIFSNFCLLFLLFHIYMFQRNLTNERIFDIYNLAFDRGYLNSSERQYRLKVFNNNLENIREHNNDPSSSYLQSVNKFSDLTFEEFSKEYLMDNPLVNYPTSLSNVTTEKCTDCDELDNLKFEFNCVLPRIDWREQFGSIQPIKDQGRCGSCYTFSANASLENAIWNKTGQSVSLSEQELVDCTNEYGNGGCNGGWMDNAYDYIIENNIGLGRRYRYRDSPNRCSNTRRKREPRYGMKAKRKYANGNRNNNVEQLQTLACSGVVAVAFEVQNGFQNYTGGLYRSPSPNCGQRLNHALNVVGFNRFGDPESGNIPYFIVRNSWGTNWGENGYAKIAFGNGDGTCGIASYIGATLPIV